MRKTWSRCLTTAMLLAVAGCITPHGPVFGDWSGRQPDGDGLDAHFVDLVLHGSPGDSSGGYEYKSVRSVGAFVDPAERNLTWDGRWTLTPVPGGPPRLDLHNLPNSEISRYALLGNGLLVPLTSGGTPNLSRYSLSYALKPVPKSNWGYGRV